jgi:excisionase family DNA binding protein
MGLLDSDEITAILKPASEMELLRVEEAGKILKVEPATVYRFIRRGILPAVKIGRTVRIDKEALTRLIKGLPLPVVDVTQRK